MKWMGMVLIFLSAGYGYVIYRNSIVFTLRLLRAIADDLSLLKCRICVQRYAMPRILDEDLGGGLSGRYLWTPLAMRVSRAEGTLSDCWDRSMDELPPVISQRLSPLGKLLLVGGDTLGDAIDEIQKEMLQFAQDEEKRQIVNLRLSGAVCFSAAAFIVLALL